jgi:hypothetical protein
MTNDELKQYLIDAGIPEMRAVGLVDSIGHITDKDSADQYIAKMAKLA